MVYGRAPADAVSRHVRSRPTGSRYRELAPGETLVEHHSQRSFEPMHAMNRPSQDAATAGGADAAGQDEGSYDSPLHERVVRILTAAGFPFLLIEQGQVILSGFMVTIEPTGDVRIHWMGALEVNALPYRRTFLGAYASTLRRAGLDVAYIENAGEPFLLCEHAPPRP